MTGSAQERANRALAPLLDQARKTFRAGRTDETEIPCVRILDRFGEVPAVLHLLALVARRRGDVKTAHGFLSRAIARAPNAAEYRAEIAEICRALGRLEDTAAHYEKAVELKPNIAEFHNNLGVTLKELGRLEAAIGHYRKSLALKPDSAESHNNIANLLRLQDHHEESLEYSGQALALSPKFDAAHYGQGLALKALGHYDEAIANLDEAIRCQPDNADAHFSLAITHLLLGDFDRGWVEYEWRWESTNFPGRKITGQAWDGVPASGLRILVHAEQGYGDTMQFVRYVSWVAAKGNTVSLYCQPELKRLFETLDDVAVVVPADGAPIPRFDRYVAVMSLPRLAATTRETVPADVPYLRVPAGCAEPFCHISAGAEVKKRVGIVWAGRPSHDNDHNRSCPLEEFRPLAERHDIRLYSLQKEGGDLRRLAASVPDFQNIVDLSASLGDFADTAAALDALDLIVGVDTSVIHLAGALAKPVWVLLPFAPDWRWMLARDDSPWYPTMRLFRQSEPGDWRGVIRRLCEALDRFEE